MEKQEKEKLDKKIRFHKRLGAEKFQKVVMNVEYWKFKILKKIWPNFLKHFDKYCDFRQKIALRKAKTEEEKQAIKRKIKFSKLAMKKEWNKEKNRNYHIDENRPTEIIEYLKWNKKVHQNGLIKDGIIITFLIGGIIFHIPGAIPLLLFELISAGVNFECVNIQDYNICRMEKIKPFLKRREEKKIQKNIEQYSEAAQVIHKSLEESETLPTFEDIIGNINNKEQLRQMRAFLTQSLEEREKEKAKRKGIL